MSGFNYAASISAAYASSDALPHPHARLASGRWLAFTGWESNPLDSIEKFLPVTSDFLLSQAYPGASLESFYLALAPTGFEQKPRATFRFIDPVLDQAGRSDIAVLVDHVMHLSQSRRQRLIVLAQLC